MDQASSLSLPANGRPVLPQRIEFHLAKRSASSYHDTTNFKVQTSSTTNTSRAFMSSSENALDSDIRFRMAVQRIGAGLENLGNTCFLNSVLQCLTHTEPLVAYLQSGKHQNSCHVVGFCALCAIQKHVIRALQSTGRSLAPKDLVSNLRRISRNFRNARQEDAHEYMVNLLESMHKCCLPSGIPSESSSAYEKSLVHRIFGGCLRSQVKCMQCSYCSDKFDPFLDLSLEIMKADSVYKALAHFTAPEQLDGGERQYQCQRCNQKVQAVKRLTIHKAPYVLTVHLKRFGSHISGQKIDKRVQFGPTLNLKPFVSGSYDGDLKYTLYGVLVHAGWSTHSGHYFCFVRTSTGMWHSLDDNRVYPVSEKNVLEQKAYMLFYVRDAVNNAPSKSSNMSQKGQPAANVARNGFSNTSSATNKVFENFSGKPINPVTEEKDVTLTVKNGVRGPAIGQINSNKICEDGGVRIYKDSSNNLVNADGSEALLRSNTQSSILSSYKGTPGEKSEHQNSNTALSQLSAEQDKELLHMQKTHLHESLSETNGNGSISVHGSRGNMSLKHFTEVKVTNFTKTNGMDPLLSGAEVFVKVPLDASGRMLKIPQKAEPSIEVGAGNTLNGKSDCPHSTSSSNGSVVDALRNSPGHNAKTKVPKQKVVSLHLGRRIMYGGLLNARKGRKHKKVENKGKKLVAKQLVDEDMGPSTSHVTSASTEARSKKSHKKRTRSPKKTSPGCNESDASINGLSSVKDFDGEFCKRASSGTTAENGGDKPVKSTENQAAAVKHWGNGESTGLKLEVGIGSNPGQYGTADNPASLFGTAIVAQWDNVDPEKARAGNTLIGESAKIGYVPDEWDEEYDRGKRKKLRMAKLTFDGPNPFQEIASSKASKSKKLKIERYNLANQPFRI